MLETMFLGKPASYWLDLECFAEAARSPQGEQFLKTWRYEKLCSERDALLKRLEIIELTLNELKNELFT